MEETKPEALSDEVQTYMYLAATHLPGCVWRADGGSCG